MNRPVYHYTDTSRLPWILSSAQLQPGRNALGGFPDPDFLWATTSPVGDRTASAYLDGLRAGRVRFVRFALSASDFEPWREIVKRFPAWTPAEVARLEHAAFGRSDPRTWRCRTDPVPIDRWQSIETRTWVDRAWRPLTPPFRIMPLDSKSLAVVIGRKVYASTVFDGPSGSVGYIPSILNAEEALDA